MEDNKDLSVFVINFCGQLIQITSTLMGSDPHSSFPIFYEGILIDYDNDYLYLGQTPYDIDQAVSHKIIASINIIEEKSIFEEILNQTPVSKKEDAN